MPVKRGDNRQTGIQAPESSELGLAVTDRLGNSGKSAVKPLGSSMSVYL